VVVVDAVWAMVEVVDAVELVELDFDPLPPQPANPIDSRPALTSAASSRLVWRTLGDCSVTGNMVTTNATPRRARSHPRDIAGSRE